MYALEHRVRSARGSRTWVRYALCGRATPLERVRLGQSDAESWRVIPIASSIRSACCAWRAANEQPYRRAG